MRDTEKMGMGVLLLFVACAFAFSQCNDAGGSSPTDVVTITDVNSAINEKDIAAGVHKTNNFVPSVKMSHEKHEAQGIKCVQCHHKEKNDDRIKQCAACHKGDKGRDLMHNFCVDCHMKASQGPTQCQQCHQY
ncbi:MAG: cytochrome c family protein [Spirochaetes bacterium]|nr:cytochrome c family protein [Spirochaetota bacterium]